MLVRYRVDSIPSMSDLKADIDGIIQGTITQPSQLSDSAKTNSVFYGTYPTGAYSRVNQTTYTYSKVHSTDNTKTHYFRLTYDSTSLSTFTVAHSYTSGTDTLLNTNAQSVNIVPSLFNSYYNFSIDIIVSTKMIGFFSPSGSRVSLNDMGHTGVTRAYTSSMMMACVVYPPTTSELNVATYVTQNPIFKTTTNAYVPYTYNLDTLTYGSLVYGFTATIPYKRVTSIGGTLAIIENPTYIDSPSSGYASHLLYGVNKIPTNSMGGFKVYSDGAGLYRFTAQDFSFLVD